MNLAGHLSTLPLLPGGYKLQVKVYKGAYTGKIISVPIFRILWRKYVITQLNTITLSIAKSLLVNDLLNGFFMKASDVLLVSYT